MQGYLTAESFPRVGRGEALELVIVYIPHGLEVPNCGLHVGNKAVFWLLRVFLYFAISVFPCDVKNT
jgi:hypothetical protein